MKKVCQHLTSCQAAQSMAPDLKRRSFTIEKNFDTLVLKVFANWFCAFIHETESIEKGIHVLRPSVNDASSLARKCRCSVHEYRGWCGSGP